MLFVHNVSGRLYRFENLFGESGITSRCLDCKAVMHDSNEMLAHRCAEVESCVIKCCDVTGNCFQGPLT
jgi:hypothetical protein